MALRRKTALPVHRLLYGCAGFITNFAVPAYIYSVSGDILLPFLFLIAKYVASAVIAPSIKSMTRSMPLILMFAHTFCFLSANLTLLYLGLSLVPIVIIASLFAMSEIFYNSSLNIIFAVTVPDSLATVIQMPFAAGLILSSIIELGLAMPYIPKLWIVIVGFFSLILSSIPLVFNKNRITALNLKILESEVKTPYRNIRRDLFHISLGLFNGVAFEVLPFYLLVHQGAFKFALPLFLLFEAARLIFIKVGEIVYKKGLYNLAMAVCPAILASLLVLSVFFKEQRAAYYLYAAVAAVFPLNFIPKFSSYNAAIQKENKVHYNQTRREFFLAVAKICAPFAFFLSRSFDLVILLGAAAAVAMFLTSFDFGSRQKIIYSPAVEDI